MRLSEQVATPNDPSLIEAVPNSIDLSIRPFEERLAADLIDTYRDRLHAESAPSRVGRASSEGASYTRRV